MATTVERVSILETKVDGIHDKMDNIQEDVKTNHTDIKNQLKTMYEASCKQHAELNDKISDLEKFKNKWIYTIAGGVAVAAYMVGHLDLINKLFI
jgi:SMC interacting uncharacterized protein involved in chromosome segregation